MYNKEKLISLFLDLQSKLGRQPKKKDWVKDNKTPSDMPIRTIFGTWGNFLKEFDMEIQRFIPAKNGKTRKGTRNKSRKRIINKLGYAFIYEPDHPVSLSNGYCLEHRVIAWDKGILKNLDDVVHHKDRNKKNNDISNLEVMSNENHTSIHANEIYNEKANECSVNQCQRLTSGKYGICDFHYKVQWGRMRKGEIVNILEDINQRARQLIKKKEDNVHRKLKFYHAYNPVGEHICGVIASTAKKAKKMVYRSDYAEDLKWLEISIKWNNGADISGFKKGVFTAESGDCLVAIKRGLFDRQIEGCEHCDAYKECSDFLESN